MRANWRNYEEIVKVDRMFNGFMFRAVSDGSMVILQKKGPKDERGWRNQVKMTSSDFQYWLKGLPTDPRLIAMAWFEKTRFKKLNGPECGACDDERSSGGNVRTRRPLRLLASDKRSKDGARPSPHDD
jgi:hypothetical protein